MKTIPWHGKLNRVENHCPHCGAKHQWSEESTECYELSARVYKKCKTCNGEFVDTYLISFGDELIDEGHWEEERPYECAGNDHRALFQDLDAFGHLIYDEENPDEDKDYYDITPQSIHFIKGE